MILVQSSSGEAREISPSARRLHTLDEVYTYISELDLGDIRKNLIDPTLPNERSIELAHANFCELHYKRWLFLRRKHEGRALPPSYDIDIFWHAHILDTFRYFEDCDRIFGYYFHHFPYFGRRGDEDARNLKSAFADTLDCYRNQFGVELPMFLHNLC